MFHLFREWLSIYPTKLETLFLLALLFFLEVLIVTTFDNLYLTFCNCTFDQFVDERLSLLVVDNIPVSELVFGVAAEELLFRIIPLGITLYLWGMRNITIVILFISSIIFGILHGGIINIFIQGIGGLMYGIFFIKYSQPNREFVLRSFALEQNTRLTGDRFLLASVVIIWLHFTYNVSLILFYTMLNGSISFPPLAAAW